MPDPIVLRRMARTRGATARSTTWWGRAFVRSFEELTLEADDLGRGRALARSGRLGAIVVLEAMASAVVDPGSTQPLMAQVRVDRLTPEAWTTFAREAARESGYTVSLEAGELPIELVEHTDDAGVELIPGSGDIDSACECDSWAQPCVHSLGLLYQLAWQVDADPYVLMLLRGRTREDLLAEVAALASGGQTPGSAQREEVRVRAAQILALAEDAPDGHGLADAAVAAYDEAVSRLL